MDGEDQEGRDNRKDTILQVPAVQTPAKKEGKRATMAGILIIRNLNRRYKLKNLKVLNLNQKNKSKKLKNNLKN